MTTVTARDATVLRDALGPLRDREQIALRLLESSAKHSFDPDTELDWDAAVEDGKWFGNHVRYALTEIADECRHSMMFGRMIDWGGAPTYPVPRVYHNLARVLKTVSTTPGSFAATLLGEEILDWMQRLTFPDDRVQTLVRGVTRIHVIEEARHVRYAREELRRQMVTAPRWERELTKVSCGEAARVFSVCFVNPQVYENVGLDRREAVAQVKASGHRAEVMQSGAKRLTDFFDDIGLLNGVGRRLWRSSGLLA
ncbi:AurF N-oxygenase family protein [Streptomyces globisporus]|uniref:Diiron oxygenase n=1 Tax=Streptomyces globisporus TaxID=1908 RepID=A0A423UPL2_STRGL|nr:diiron oxygenase [Streptomyces globisporus]ROV64272.1 diiron oxygenase [Streptomyces globisporus]